MLYACAPITQHYVQVEQHIARQEFLKADGLIQKHERQYGDRNALLYALDRAMALHYAGRYAESNRHLEAAKSIAETLYTRSLSTETGALFTNDLMLPYEGEDFERVLIHLVAALNYAYLGQFQEAVVEARQVDHRLNLLGDRYARRPVYREDAFARYLSGLLFEAMGEYNDAWIAYRKAWEAYQTYQAHYGTPAPKDLQADLLRLTERLGLQEEHRRYRDAFGDPPYPSSHNLGEVIFIAYLGLAPLKEEVFVALPIPDGSGGTLLVNMAFPRFVDRRTGLDHARMLIHGEGNTFQVKSVLVEDITAIAKKDLEDRLDRITAKTIARAGAKYLLARQIRRQAGGQGEVARVLADLGTNLYALFSERTDTRSWRTLPGQIQMARAWLSPGVYQIRVEYRDRHGRTVAPQEIGEVRIDAGEKRFFQGRRIGQGLRSDAGP